MKKTATLITLLFLTGSLFAQNGTSIEMKFSSDQGAQGTMKGLFSTIGRRIEMSISLPQMESPMNTVTIIKNSKPEVSIRINETNKTYSEGPTTQNNNRNDKCTIENLGEEKVMGYACKHIKVTASDGNTTEMWNTKEISEYEKYNEVYNNNPRMSLGSMEKSLKEAGADGFPVKYIANKKGEATLTIELVSINKKAAIPASSYDVPAGYSKVQGPNGSGYGQPQKGNNAPPSNMTPEERAKYMEEMKAKRAAAGGGK